jgi:hypothetical protein
MKLWRRWYHLPKHKDVMDLREDEIAKLLELLSRHSDGFTNPRIILIGGYALRAYSQYSRYTRDCDFVMRKEDGWHLDTVKKWLAKETNVESFETRETHGFARFSRLLTIGRKSAKIAVDFMEGEVRGRTDEAVVLIDKRFVDDSHRVEIPVGAAKIGFLVPSYRDYFILKVVSARPSDIRDIAALVLKNGVPDRLGRRIKEMLPHPGIFARNIREAVIPAVSHERFVDSWRGTFVTKEFDEGSKETVLKALGDLAGGTAV